MIATDPQDIQNLRDGGKVLAGALRTAAALVAPGVTTAELDLAAEKYIRDNGGVPAFLGYTPDGMKSAYPAVLCVSINNEVVHGIPRDTIVLEEGDIVSLDLGLSFNGLFVDSAITMGVGEVDDTARKLMAATVEATHAAIKAATVGNKTGDIGAAIEDVAHRTGFSCVEDLGGHGVGKAVHEKPYIPNEGPAGIGEKIVEGMVLAIEPMLAEGKGAIVLAPDQWTYAMRDGKRAAHVEHTVLITKDGPEILTKE
ncbi:MAG: methionine aminopeptidase methionyl aminopeptidase [Candidatus Adlerbacteria bacterium]|nr:methionine aminopeptidase methionyl aminopeptidase [Candidatus Adlerbacteria bacterium]